jgi:acetoacetyl-CoA reductase/3-oxoacyl-[acyl-carrier protein] reductase
MFAAAGARVIVADIEDTEGAALVASVRKAGGTAEYRHLDVASEPDWRDAVAFAKSKFGALHVLVNNAGIPLRGVDLGKTTRADWDRVLGVNLRGAFTCTQEVLPDMQAARWGRIVNVTSIGGQIGGVNQVHYAAAKAGLVSLTRSLARLYGREGITCNAVAPGLVPTDMSARELASEGGQAKVATLPLGRAGTVEEVANVVAFLAGDGAGYVTGQTVNVNGGAYLG